MTGARLAPGAIAVALLAAAPSAAAAPALTIGVRPPTTTAWVDGVTIYGVIAGGKSGEQVTFEAKECGIFGAYRLAGTTTTTAGGGFSDTPSEPPGVTTSYRARLRNIVSNVAVVHVRPRLDLAHGGRFFSVGLYGHGYVRGKKIALQRRTKTGRWLTIRTMTVGNTFGNGGSASGRARVPHGTVVRAALSARQAAPCFLAAVSNTLKT